LHLVILVHLSTFMPDGNAFKPYYHTERSLRKWLTF